MTPWVIRRPPARWSVVYRICDLSPRLSSEICKRHYGTVSWYLVGFVRNLLSSGVRSRIQFGVSVWPFIDAINWLLLCTNMQSPRWSPPWVGQLHAHYFTDSVDDSSPYLLVQRCRFTTPCVHFLNCSVYFVQKEGMCRTKVTCGVGLYLDGGADRCLSWFSSHLVKWWATSIFRFCLPQTVRNL